MSEIIIIFSFFSILYCIVSPAKPIQDTYLLELELRTRDKESGTIHSVNQTIDPNKVAIIIIDPWNYHWCMTACERVGALVPRMNESLKIARKLGMKIIWAPTDVASQYAGMTQRETALAVPQYTVPKVFPDLVSFAGNVDSCSWLLSSVGGADFWASDAPQSLSRSHDT